MKNIRFKGTIIACLLLLPSVLHSQNSKIGTWKTYMAYQEAVLVAKTDNLVFGVYKGLYQDGKVHNDGSLFSYSPEDGEIITYSFQDGLNDARIIQMAYCPDVKALVLIYENSNIDLFYGRNNVVNIPSIKESSYANKTINAISIVGKYAYLSTGFGIVVLDLERKEVKEEYRLYLNTMAMCRIGEYLYAATEEGIKRASTSLNLLDKGNWQPFELKYGGDAKGIQQMTSFNDQLVFFDRSRPDPSPKVYYVDKEGNVKLLFSGMVRQLSVLNEQLILNVYNSVFFYTDLNKGYTQARVTANSICASNSSDTYWIAQLPLDWVDPALTGLIEIKKETGSNEFSVLTSGIKVNSPLRNYCSYMTFSSGKLLVVGGEWGSDRSNIEGTFMIYENGKWTNFDDKAIAKQAGLDFCRDFVSAVVDPRDPKHYFVASWGEGLLEFQDTAFVKCYSTENSSLQTSLPSHPSHYVRVDGLAYDTNNNLFMVNQLVPNALSVLTADNKWLSYAVPPLAGAHPNKIVITRNNQKWVNLPRLDAGICVFDDNNTLDNPSDDTYYYSQSFVDQQGTAIASINYLCLAEDLNGTVWAGTDNGLISFSSAAQMGEGVCNRIISTNQYGDGYYPMDEQRINTIAIDGGNRKWMGTRGAGVFVLDNSGESLKVDNFNTSNSRLISDNILSIAIDNQTGEVFIGTDRGLVSYMNEAIEGKSAYSDVYAYPNPIRPSSTGLVTITGLMMNSTIKITDVAGNLVHQGISLGGQYQWNCANRAGAIVKAGIYLVFAAQPDGTQGVVTKIMVIK